MSDSQWLLNWWTLWHHPLGCDSSTKRIRRTKGLSAPEHRSQNGNLFFAGKWYEPKKRMDDLYFDPKIWTNDIQWLHIGAGWSMMIHDLSSCIPVLNSRHQRHQASLPSSVSPNRWGSDNRRWWSCWLGCTSFQVDGIWWDVGISWQQKSCWWNACLDRSSEQNKTNRLIFWSSFGDAEKHIRKSLSNLRVCDFQSVDHVPGTKIIRNL